MLMEEVVEEGCNRVDGKGKRETRLHSLEMRMVTMATAAESHMMRRSERERWIRECKKKSRQRAGLLALPADDKGGEGGNTDGGGMDCRRCEGKRGSGTSVAI